MEAANQNSIKFRVVCGETIIASMSSVKYIVAEMDHSSMWKHGGLVGSLKRQIQNSSFVFKFCIEMISLYIFEDMQQNYLFQHFLHVLVI